MVSPCKSLQVWVKLFSAYLLKKNCCDLNLGEGLYTFTFFLFPDSVWFYFDPQCERQSKPSCPTEMAR